MHMNIESKRYQAREIGGNLIQVIDKRDRLIGTVYSADFPVAHALANMTERAFDKACKLAIQESI